MKKIYKLFCLIFALALCASAVPTQAFAAGDEGIMPLSLTFDNEFPVPGEMEVRFSHFGDFQYDARFYIQNNGDVTVNYKICNEAGYCLAQGRVLPNRDHTGTLTQAYFKWNLSDGRYTAHFSTDDGSTGDIYFKYRVLD